MPQKEQEVLRGIMIKSNCNNCSKEFEQSFNEDIANIPKELLAWKVCGKCLLGNNKENDGKIISIISNGNS